MKETWKRLAALALTLSMILTLIPLGDAWETAYAAGSYGRVTKNGTRVRKQPEQRFLLVQAGYRLWSARCWIRQAAAATLGIRCRASILTARRPTPIRALSAATALSS